MNLQHMKMQMLELGILILAAYIGGLIAKKLKIGAVIGQILGGVLVGPHFLELLHIYLSNHPSLANFMLLKPIYHFYNSGFDEYREILESYHFFVFLFLGLIAFSIGEELHRNRLKQVGIKATLICLIQGLLTFIIILLGFRFIFGFRWITSLIIGSIGIATAPALTFIMMANNQQEALFELAQYMVKQGVINETVEISNALMEREKLSSTGIGNAIAIPHCRIPHIKETQIACGILKRPLQWFSPDKKPVEILFLILTPEDRPREHLKVLSLIAAIVKKPEFVNRFKNAVFQNNVDQYRHLLDLENMK